MFIGSSSVSTDTRRMNDAADERSRCLRDRVKSLVSELPPESRSDENFARHRTFSGKQDASDDEKCDDDNDDGVHDDEDARGNGNIVIDRLESASTVEKLYEDTSTGQWSTADGLATIYTPRTEVQRRRPSYGSGWLARSTQQPPPHRAAVGRHSLCLSMIQHPSYSVRHNVAGASLSQKWVANESLSLSSSPVMGARPRTAGTDRRYPRTRHLCTGNMGAGGWLTSRESSHMSQRNYEVVGIGGGRGQCEWGRGMVPADIGGRGRLLSSSSCAVRETFAQPAMVGAHARRRVTVGGGSSGMHTAGDRDMRVRGVGYRNSVGLDEGEFERGDEGNCYDEQDVSHGDQSGNCRVNERQVVHEDDDEDDDESEDENGLLILETVKPRDGYGGGRGITTVNEHNHHKMSGGQTSAIGSSLALEGRRVSVPRVNLSSILENRQLPVVAGETESSATVLSTESKKDARKIGLQNYYIDHGNEQEVVDLTLEDEEDENDESEENSVDSLGQQEGGDEMEEVSRDNFGPHNRRTAETSDGEDYDDDDDEHDDENGSREWQQQQEDCNLYGRWMEVDRGHRPHGHCESLSPSSSVAADEWRMLEGSSMTTKGNNSRQLVAAAELQKKVVGRLDDVHQMVDNVVVPRMRALTDENKKLNERVAVLQAQLDAADQEIADHLGVSTSVKEELRASKADFRSLEAEHRELQSLQARQFREHETEISRLKNVNQDAMRHLRTVENEVAALRRYRRDVAAHSSTSAKGFRLSLYLSTPVVFVDNDKTASSSSFSSSEDKSLLLVSQQTLREESFPQQPSLALPSSKHRNKDDDNGVSCPPALSLSTSTSPCRTLTVTATTAIVVALDGRNPADQFTQEMRPEAESRRKMAVTVRDDDEEDEDEGESDDEGHRNRKSLMDELKDLDALIRSSGNQRLPRLSPGDSGGCVNCGFPLAATDGSSEAEASAAGPMTMIMRQRRSLQVVGPTEAAANAFPATIAPSPPHATGDAAAIVDGLSSPCGLSPSSSSSNGNSIIRENSELECWRPSVDGERERTVDDQIGKLSDQAQEWHGNDAAPLAALATGNDQDCARSEGRQKNIDVTQAAAAGGALLVCSSISAASTAGGESRPSTVASNVIATSSSSSSSGISTLVQGQGLRISPSISTCIVTAQSSPSTPTGSLLDAKCKRPPRISKCASASSATSTAANGSPDIWIARVARSGQHISCGLPTGGGVSRHGRRRYRWVETLLELRRAIIASLCCSTTTA